MKKNKYENIQMLDLDDKEMDIAEVYINHLYNTEKTVGIVANKEIIEYIMTELFVLDEVSVNLVDLSDTLASKEYMITVDNNGVMNVVPFCAGFADEVDIVYIDMDGDVRQAIINYFVNNDKEVILFGQKDNDCDDNCGSYTINESDKDKYEIHTSEDVDGNTHGFTASRSDGDSYMSYSYYSNDELSHEDIQKVLKAFGF